MKNKDLFLLVCLGTLAIAFRLFSTIPNFSPIGAIAIFSGLLVGRKFYSFAFPIAIMIVSDLLLGLIDSSYIHPLMPVVYLSYFILVFIGSSLKSTNNNFLKTIGYTLAGSIAFFLITNFGVWVQGSLYALNIEGFISCYVNAIPFFRNTLIGDLLFATSFYLIIQTAYRLVPSKVKS
jgi:hypothetical protein